MAGCSHIGRLLRVGDVIDGRWRVVDRTYTGRRRFDLLDLQTGVMRTLSWTELRQLFGGEVRKRHGANQDSSL